MTKQLDEFSVFQDFVAHKISNKIDEDEVFVEWNFPTDYFVVDFDLRSKNRFVVVQHKEYPTRYFMFSWTGNCDSMPSCSECEEYYPPVRREWREVI